ncbi:MAG: hypothetical protein R6W83_02060 [Cryobacterium sp.]
MTRRLPYRLTQLLLGLFLFGIGIALMVRGEIGVAPWDVLAQGIDRLTGWGFGLITILISGVVLLLWIPLREKPGIGTLANAVLVGLSADVGLRLVPAGLDLIPRVLLFAAGLLLVAVASGLYIGAHLGSGPRDGLMTGLHRRTGYKIWVVRTALESSVLLVGWALGGNVGIGTVLFALLIGPLCGYTIPFFAIALPAAQQTPTRAGQAQKSRRVPSRAAARR